MVIGTVDLRQAEPAVWNQGYVNGDVAPANVSRRRNLIFHHTETASYPERCDPTGSRPVFTRHG